MPMNQVDDTIRKIRREVRTVVRTSILAKAPGYIHARESFAERELYVGIRLVVAQQNIKARLFLLDEVIFECERFLIVGDDQVVDIHRFAHQRPGLRVLPAALMEIRTDPRAQVLRLADVDDLALGVLIEIHSGRGRQAADFLGKVHSSESLLQSKISMRTKRVQPEAKRSRDGLVPSPPRSEARCLEVVSASLL